MFRKVIKNVLNYKILEYSKTVATKQALDVFKSKSIRNYYSLTFDLNSTTFNGAIFICPYCGAMTSANIHLFPKEFRSIQKENDTFVCYKNANSLTNLENTFKQNLDELEAKNLSRKTISFGSNISSTGPHICPVCNKKSKSNEYKCDTLIECTEKEITVSVKIDSFIRLLEEVKALGGKCVVNVSQNDFPIYEVLRFNLAEHKTTLEIKANDNSKVLSEINLFDKNSLPLIGLMGKVTENRTVLNAIKAAFLSSNVSCPFAYSEICIEWFVILTKFSGFESDFYDAIPFCEMSFLISNSFEGISQKLSTPEDAIKIFNDSNLPKIKSVKKFIFNNLGVLFYTTELEKMWSILQDANLFVDFLGGQNLFDMLSFVHSFPYTWDFLDDIIKVRGKVFLCKNLNLIFNNSHIIFQYLLANENLKQEILKMLVDRKSRRNIFEIPLPSPNDFILNTPSIPSPNSSFAPCKINEYSFIPQTSTRKIELIGEKLDNCLKKSFISKFSYHIIAIYKKNKPIAVMEYRNNQLRQTFAYANRNIDIKSDLMAAIFKVCEENGIDTLKWLRYTEGIDELPF